MMITILFLIILLLLIRYYYLHSTKKGRLYLLPGPSAIPLIGNVLPLMVPQGIKWQTRRKILTPTFHFNILKQFVDILVEESDCMVKILKKETVVKDLASFMSEHTLNIICETSMGINLRDSTVSQQYRDAVDKLIKIACYRCVRFWLHSEWLFKLLPIGRMQKKYLTLVHNITDNIIAKRKRYHELTNGQYLKNIENDKAEEIDDVQISGIKTRRLAMLDLLIAMSRENNLSDSDIREKVNTFMFGGHDTLASATCFTLMLLAEHRDIQNRVRFEVNTVMKENENKFTMSVLQQLPYLERCIKESLRLYPSVPFISRQISTDVKLHSHLIPAGTYVNPFIYCTHRDPNFWPNPDVFDPDRFLPEMCRNRHPYAYIPFSAGPRNCIGQRYAMLELKAIIASLVHNFYLESVDYLKDVGIKAELVLRFNCPVRMKFVPIESV